MADAALSGSELAAVRPLEAILFEAMLPEAMPLEARLPEAIVAEAAADEAADNAELLDAAIVAAAAGVLSAWILSEVAPSALVAVEIADEAVDDIGVSDTAMVAAGVLRARVTAGDLGLSSLVGVRPTSVAAEVERPLRTSLGASVRTGGVREGGVLGDGAFCVPEAGGLWPFRLFAMPHLPPIAASDRRLGFSIGGGEAPRKPFAVPDRLQLLPVRQGETHDRAEARAGVNEAVGRPLSRQGEAIGAAPPGRPPPPIFFIRREGRAHDP